MTAAMKQLLRYFLHGLFVLAPLALTLYIGWQIFAFIDDLLPIGIPGLGFLLTVILITVVGFLSTNVAGKAVIDEAERLLSKVPLIKLLYTSIRDLINAFVGEKKRFDRPVAVRLTSGAGAMALGFVTRDSLHYLEQGGPKGAFATHVAVYFPQSYNFAGNLLIVPRESVTVLHVASADVMAFIVSGGVSGLGIGEHGQSVPPPPSVELTQPIPRDPTKPIIIDGETGHREN